MANQLSLYRRHNPSCPHSGKDQNYTKCSCPIWCDGELDGKRFRKSVGLRDWARAVKRREVGDEAACGRRAADGPAANRQVRGPDHEASFRRRRRHRPAAVRFGPAGLADSTGSGDHRFNSTFCS